MSRESRPRKSEVPQEELANRIESIFGKKPPKERYVPPPLPPELQKQSSHEKSRTAQKDIGETQWTLQLFWYNGKLQKFRSDLSQSSTNLEVLDQQTKKR